MTIKLGITVLSTLAFVCWVAGCGILGSRELALDASANGEEQKVAEGTTIALHLTEPGSVPPEYQFHWDQPTITGDAVTFDKTVTIDDVKHLPGAAGRFKFLFKAVTAGTAEIRIHRTAGAKVEREDRGDLCLKIRVK